MSDDELIERIASAVAERISPSDGLWSARTIARYMDFVEKDGKVSQRTVLERYAPHPDFPKAIRVPTVSGGRGRPRWKESEIRKWWEKHKERRASDYPYRK